MGNGIGERTLFTTTFGRSIQVLANAQGARWKTGGVTIDWDTVVACPANASTYYAQTVAGGKVTFEDNVDVLVGEKALRYGTILMRDASTGKYRPALTADGGSLKKGETFILNETVTEDDYMSNHPGVLDGGKVHKVRIAFVANTATVMAAGVPPTEAQLNAVMPGILYSTD